jgi:hypothetical protein
VNVCFLSALISGCSEEAAAPASQFLSVTTDAVGRAKRAASRHPVMLIRDLRRDRRQAGRHDSEMPVRIGQQLANGALIARVDAAAFRGSQVRAEADVQRLTRAAARNRELLPAGTISGAMYDDTSIALAVNGTVARARQLRSPCK